MMFVGKIVGLVAAAGSAGGADINRALTAGARWRRPCAGGTSTIHLSRAIAASQDELAR